MNPLAKRPNVFATASGARLVNVADGILVYGARGEVAAVLLGALVGSELDGEAAAGKLLGQSGSWKEMSARASGGEQNGPYGQAVCPLAPVASLSCSVRAGDFIRPAMGRLRVSPSAKPMVSAMASSDDPP